jgi:hypothetical protein
VHDHAVNAIGLFIEAIITQLVPNEQKHQRATRHPDHETGDIDESVTFVPAQIAQGDFEVVFEHGFSISDLGLRISDASLMVEAAIRNPQYAIIHTAAPRSDSPARL